ncbi:hypothetical protein [Dechloromonas sp. A34]|uniref:hypothetical protein n=1 Tax=Dechloromonas sp. A34 TaxID=447588 RepID=UPI002249617F|nr:hypothetical protein [Dechloromonas sp. A34]
MHATWGNRSSFDYVGSIETGTEITFGNGRVRAVSAQQYSALRKQFLNQVVAVGTSRTAPPNDSIGNWLQSNVTKTAIASYVAPILVREGYAERVGTRDIRIIK